MFSRRSAWTDYQQDILAFCELLHTPPWTPSQEATTFLLAVQRGYRRVGLTGARDGWMAMAAACLWRACCYPDHIQFVMAGPLASSQAWIRFLKTISSGSHASLREHLLFTQDGTSILCGTYDDPAISVLDPSHLSGITSIHNSRPTVLVMSDLEKVPTSWFPALAHLIEGEKDQWLMMSPVRR